MDDERRNSDGAITAGLIGCMFIAVVVVLLVAGFGVVAFQSRRAKLVEQAAMEAERAAKEAQMQLEASK